MGSARLRRPVNLVLDFDSTLTVSDTTSVLGNISQRSQSFFKDVVDAYVAKSAEFKKTPFRWTSHNREEYSTWLNSRRDVEFSSVQLAQDCEMFAGLTIADLDAAIDRGFASGDIQLRDGWSELVTMIKDSQDIGSRLSIVSVNWSATFIRRVLCKAAAASTVASTGPADTLEAYLNQVEIAANEIHGLDLPGGSLGQLIRSPPSSDLRTSGDKLKHFRRITANANHLAAKTGDPRPLSVYVGDSSTDFECLCEADVGIWLFDIHQSDVGEKFNEVFKPLKASPPVALSADIASPLRKQKALSGEEGPLFTWTADFQTIIRFLLDFEDRPE